MATSRLTRFVMEVAPPQFVTVMRCRSRKMLDTISEEDRDGASNHESLSPTSNKSLPTSFPMASMAAAAAASSSSSFASSSSTAVTTHSKYFLKGVSSFSIFDN